MTKNITILKNITLITLLVAIAVEWRIINHNFGIAPNLELITVASVLAAIIIGWKAAVIVPISSIILSDLIIGNSSIFVFTWSSFALIGIGALLLRKLNNKPKSQIIFSLGFAVASSFAFFVITNFGVWAQGWYPATLAGLINCYAVALPFYRTMLIGNMIIVPIAISVWQLAKARELDKEFASKLI